MLVTKKSHIFEQNCSLPPGIKGLKSSKISRKIEWSGFLNQQGCISLSRSFYTSLQKYVKRCQYAYYSEAVVCSYTVKQMSEAWNLMKKKKRIWHRCFFFFFSKFSRTFLFIEHLRWLLLIIPNFEHTQQINQFHLLTLNMYSLWGIIYLVPIQNFQNYLTQNFLIFFTPWYGKKC